MADRVGQQWGQYQLLQLLHKEGVAEVYLAEHVRLGTQAVIKILHTNLAGEDIELFRTEAIGIRRLSHPHIARMLNVGVEDSVPYLIMEYAPGGTLRQRLPQYVPLPPASVLPFIQQVATAVQYAHNQGIAHRNIKPENMLLNERKEMLLSDFSIAVLEQRLRYQSAQGPVAIAYMAPEQIKQHPLPASDQYALGIVAYEWLTGERPFQGSLREIGAKHLAAPPPPLREKAPQLPLALEEVILKALAKDPRARFPSIDAFVQALRISIEGQISTIRRPAASNYPSRAESGIQRPPAPTSPLFLTPPPGNRTPSAQGLPGRPRPPVGNTAARSSTLIVQRVNIPSGSLESQQPSAPPISPPALIPHLASYWLNRCARETPACWCLSPSWR